ncbi:UDP-N-acetylmuramoyl-L-alanyl-D-glutamate--2,6-diaminopimelate ligase [Candidatus Dojkabacteria bacterium]|nr:UDP-N-acetylmuramoyl-L-alanyl-D-glutamate--2,6-diaminopimelate ligase [Candidatus Dojkabacteria bacterium]
MKYSKIKNVVCAGIGGGGIYYVARFFLLLGARVTGYDLKESDNVKEIIKSGAKVKLKNPDEPFDKNTDICVYTYAYPDEIIKKLKENNSDIGVVEVGEFFDKLISDYESGKLSDKELKAFQDSDIAPLYNLDYEKVKYVGVTGTDGKTTTSSMIYDILSENGFTPGLISTVSAKIGNEEIDTGFHVTTPSSQELFKVLKKMQDANCTHIIIESTSHGLSMGRLAGVKFDVAVYTNITEEHLDYHKDWEGLYEAKSRLIKNHLKENGSVVINNDDKRSFTKLNELCSNLGIKPLVYGLSEGFSQDFNENIISAADTTFNENGIKYKLKFGNDEIACDVYIPIFGEYNVSNSLAAISACVALDVPKNIAAKALVDFKTVLGRMEILQKQPFSVIVDFAHTPNALNVALNSAVRLKKSDGNKLIVVFGCAGKRDKYKRFKMGEVAGNLADTTIITAEDPRTESLKDINDEIERGWKTTANQKSQVFMRFDDDSINVQVRRDAIIKALELAKAGDVVIMCGKGHEKSLCFGVDEFEWNDIDEVKKLLN